MAQEQTAIRERQKTRLTYYIISFNSILFNLVAAKLCCQIILGPARFMWV